MKLTPWYPAHIKPVRTGVYQTRFMPSGYTEWLEGYAFWNGNQWAGSYFHADRAYENRTWGSGAYQNKQWRGLTKETK